MKKVLLIIITLLLLTGCTIKNEKYYEMIANTAIGFFNNPDYDENTIAKEDRDALKEFWTAITHENQIIDLTKYIDKNLVSNEKNDICTIKYTDLLNEFETSKQKYEGFAPFYKASCQGYYAIIYQNDLYPDYEYTLQNPEHNYVLINKNTKEHIKSYIYKSTYNGKGLMIKLHIKNKKIEKIDAETVNANDYIQN